MQFDSNDTISKPNRWHCMYKLMLTLKISTLHKGQMTGVLFVHSLCKPKVQKINREQINWKPVLVTWLMKQQAQLKDCAYCTIVSGTRSAHHARHVLHRAHARVEIDEINFAMPPRMWLNFPTMTKSSLMNLFLNQEHHNTCSSVSLTTNC